MDKNRARFLWSQLCNETVGGNDTEAFERTTPFGVMVTSHGLPTSIYGSTMKQDALAAADFLEKWAIALRQNSI